MSYIRNFKYGFLLLVIGSIIFVLALAYVNTTYIDRRGGIIENYNTRNAFLVSIAVLIVVIIYVTGFNGYLTFPLRSYLGRFRDMYIFILVTGELGLTIMLIFSILLFGATTLYYLAPIGATPWGLTIVRTLMLITIGYILLLISLIPLTGYLYGEARGDKNLVLLSLILESLALVLATLNLLYSLTALIGGLMIAYTALNYIQSEKTSSESTA